MLMITPSVSAEHWTTVRTILDAVPHWFLDYARDYLEAVHNLPWQVQRRIIEHLVRDFGGRPLTEGTVRQIVERECAEIEFEPTNKIIRLVILRSFVQSLRGEGLPPCSQTESLLEECEERFPALLAQAVDDHFGLTAI